MEMPLHNQVSDPDEYQDSTEERADTQQQHKLAPPGGAQQFAKSCHGGKHKPNFPAEANCVRANTPVTKTRAWKRSTYLSARRMVDNGGPSDAAQSLLPDT
jgi:hypothetical protein